MFSKPRRQKKRESNIVFHFHFFIFVNFAIKNPIVSLLQAAILSHDPSRDISHAGSNIWSTCLWSSDNPRHCRPRDPRCGCWNTKEKWHINIHYNKNKRHVCCKILKRFCRTTYILSNGWMYVHVLSVN